jgi:hypothetical protein
MRKTVNVNLWERNEERYRRIEGERKKYVDRLNSPMCET